MIAKQMHVNDMYEHISKRKYRNLQKNRDSAVQSILNPVIMIRVKRPAINWPILTIDKTIK
jgi:hypothetical protein